MAIQASEMKLRILMYWLNPITQFDSRKLNVILSIGGHLQIPSNNRAMARETVLLDNVVSLEVNDARSFLHDEQWQDIGSNSQEVFLSPSSDQDLSQLLRDSGFSGNAKAARYDPGRKKLFSTTGLIAVQVESGAGGEKTAQSLAKDHALNVISSNPSFGYYEMRAQDPSATADTLQQLRQDERAASVTLKARSQKFYPR